MQRFRDWLRLGDERTRQSDICRRHTRCKLRSREDCIRKLRTDQEITMNLSRAAIMTTVAVIGFALSAAASAGTDTPTLTVKYNDLNVESEQGARELYSRLRTASRHVCSAFEGRELRQRAAWKECYQEALTKAVMDLNVERLTALHLRKQTDRAS